MTDHLHPAAREMLVLPAQARIEYMNSDRWIGYSHAATIIGRLEDAVTFPKARRSNLLIIGDPSNGKTTLLDRFVRKHPVIIPKIGSGEEPSLPVVMFDMPANPSEGRFYGALLTAQEIPFKDRDSAEAKSRMSLRVLRANHTRMLIIDEFHNLLHGSAKEVRELLATIRILSNTLKIPLVAAGTRDAVVALNHDGQLTTRFEIINLPRWNLDEEFLRLLVTWEALLPLPKPSQLASRDMATALFSLSNGTIGGLTDVLCRATIAAIRSGAENLRVDDIKEAGKYASHQFAREAGTRD